MVGTVVEFSLYRPSDDRFDVARTTFKNCPARLRRASAAIRSADAQGSL